MQQVVNRDSTAAFLAIRACINVINIRHVQESGLFQPDIDKSRLHSGEHPVNPTLVYIADNTATGLTFNTDFLQRSIFDNGNPGFLGSYIYEYFFIYDHN